MTEASSPEISSLLASRRVPLLREDMPRAPIKDCNLKLLDTPPTAVERILITCFTPFSANPNSPVEGLATLSHHLPYLS